MLPLLVVVVGVGVGVDAVVVVGLDSLGGGAERMLVVAEGLRLRFSAFSAAGIANMMG